MTISKTKKYNFRKIFLKRNINSKKLFIKLRKRIEQI